MKEQAKKLFSNAEEKLKAASNELYRPIEDVVTYSVCKNVQHAVEGYLKGYLMKKGIDPAGLDSIDKLYQNCLDLDPSFSEINISDFGCKDQSLGSEYCEDFKSVDSCYSVAEKLSSYIKKI